MNNTLPDKIGIAGSVICIIHCLFLPYLFSLFYLTDSIPEELGGDYIFLIVNGVAVWFSARSTPFPLFRKFFIVFFVGLAACIITSEFYEPAEYLAVACTFCLAGVHLLNILRSGKKATSSKDIRPLQDLREE